MRALLRALVCCIVVWGASALADPPPRQGVAPTVGGRSLPPSGHAIDFTPQELDWMRAHPVVRYTLGPHLGPLQYVEDSQPEGLLVQYLQNIAEATPLTFEFVYSSGWDEAVAAFAGGKIDLLAGAFLRPKDQLALGPVLPVVPYYAGSVMVVGQYNHPVVLEPRGLSGMRIAVSEDYATFDMLRESVPDAELVVYDSPKHMLDAVVRGEVEVAVAPDIVLLPLVLRAYRSQLGIAGTLTDLPVVQRMWVSPDDSILQSILNKAMLSLSAGQTDEILDVWLASIDFGRPSASVLLRYYSTEVALVVALVVLLASTVMFTLRSRRQARRSAERKLRFLATVSHEIRTAMNAVVGPIELLVHESDIERRRELVDTAGTGARVLLETVNSMLDLSTLRARKASIDPSPTDMTVLVHEVMKLLRGRVPEGVAFDSQIELSQRVVLDAGKYRQVLMNLLTNAMKFTERGAITVNVGLRRRGARTWLDTCVADTGSGIAPRELQAIFDAYTQAHDETVLMVSTIDSPRRGTGLGLAICQELIELQNGHIHVSSTVGMGTTLCFELPVALADDAQLASVSSASGQDRAEGDERGFETSAPDVAALVQTPAAQRGEVLAVDDNPVNLMVLKKQLETLHWPASHSTSGHDALTRLHDGDFALLLLDCNMPGIDGYEVAARVRDRESVEGLPRVSIVALSAHTDAVHQARCVDSGMDAVLVKPITIQTLSTTLQRWAVRAPVAPTEHQGYVPPDDDEIARIFVQANREDEAALLTALAARDAHALAAQAHRVRGAALVMQEARLLARADALEQLALAESCDWEQITAVLHALSAAMQDYAARVAR